MTSRRPAPDKTFEAAFHARGLLRVAGIDEVGRGPLAGPVVAAAVVLDFARVPVGLADSKALTATRRAALAQEIAAQADVSIAEASVAEIDRLNIRGATHLAMRRALDGLPGGAVAAVIDGRDIPAGWPCPAEAVVKGDARCLSVAAASIVAKEYRDALMRRLAEAHPGYGWERNAGYPTAEHRAALQHLGVTPHHRRSFGPVRNML